MQSELNLLSPVPISPPPLTLPMQPPCAHIGSNLASALAARSVISTTRSDNIGPGAMYSSPGVSLVLMGMPSMPAMVLVLAPVPVVVNCGHCGHDMLLGHESHESM